MTLENQNVNYDLHKKLTGLQSKGSPPSEPYRHQHPDIQALTSRLAITVERAAVTFWGNGYSSAIQTEQIESWSQLVRGQLSKISGKGNISHAESAEPYQSLVSPVPIPFGLGDQREPEIYGPLLNLITTFDDLLGAGLMQEIKRLPDFLQQISPNIRHVTETALILSRLATEQSPIPSGILLPNQFVVGANGTNLVQFDGALVPHDHPVSSKPPNTYLMNYWNGNSPWIALQVKTPLRVRFVNNPRTLNKNPFPRDIREFQEQCVRIMLGMSPDTFVFPRSVIFAYLRGLQPHVIHFVHLNAQFFRTWIQDVEESFVSNNFLGAELKSATYVYQRLLREEEKHTQVEREQLEKSQAQKGGRRSKQRVLIPRRVRGRNNPLVTLDSPNQPAAKKTRRSRKTNDQKSFEFSKPG